MALPKLNSNPKFELTIPSTGKKVRFRPFLVKEEKALMIAMESGNNMDALNGLLDTIAACCDDLNVNALTTFDIEYLFLQVRAKSVGETAKVGLKCNNCNQSTEVSIKVDDLKVDIPEIEKTIQIDSDISIDVDWPRFTDMIQMNRENPTTDDAFKMMGKCIKSIITKEEKINVDDVAYSELLEFMESMNTSQFTKIKEFVDKIPRIKHDVSFKCKNCEHENNVTVEGVESFLL